MQYEHIAKQLTICMVSRQLLTRHCGTKCNPAQAVYCKNRSIGGQR